MVSETPENARIFRKCDKVLILIVVEYGLGVYVHAPSPSGQARVLILIVVEYGLGEKDKWYFGSEFFGLNPYCSGIWSRRQYY